MATPDKESDSNGHDLTELSALLVRAAASGPQAVLATLASELPGQASLSGAATNPVVAGIPNDHDVQQILGDGWLLEITSERVVDPTTANAITLAITSALAVQQREAIDREKRASETLLRLLNEPESAPELVGEEPRRLIALVARPDGESAHLDVGMAHSWAATIRSRDPRALIGTFSHEFVAILADDPALNSAAAVSSLLGSPGYSWGISGVIQRWEEVKQAYEAAGTALDVGRMLHGPGQVGEIQSLGTYRLLAQIPDSDELRTFLADTLGELSTRTDAEAVDLRRSLQVLLDCNINIAETARRLHFHYNTVRYRLVKLEQMLGPFSADAELRLAIALALRILQIRGV
jgi:hypothetical protein